MNFHFIQCVIPNLFTTLSLYFGYLSLLAIMNDEIIQACYLILGSLVFDGLDGKVARLLKANTAFGSQFDSLSDVICFGLVPTILIQTILPNLFRHHSQFIMFFFLAATALRLARFQIQDNQAAEYFTGLPCPAAGMHVISLVLLKYSYPDFFQQDALLRIIASSFLLNTLLMISTIPYPSFKKLNHATFLWLGILTFMTILGWLYSVELALVSLLSTYNLILPFLVWINTFKKSSSGA